MSFTQIKVVVPGSLNTDIITSGHLKILKSGEYSSLGQLQITAGGKSRNVAQMMASLLPPETIAMLAKTCRDEYGLWKPPLIALQKAGVNTDGVIIETVQTGVSPSIALIAVDRAGNNQIYVSTGFADTFSPDDIKKAAPVFEAAKNNSGICAQTLELPLPTALFSIQTANHNKLKVILDPGGINTKTDYQPLLGTRIYLIKPNEHEAKILTGNAVKDFNSAKVAANRLLKCNIQNVLITHGVKGAYFFNSKTQIHIPIPAIKLRGPKDETGCGDQTMATLCAYLVQGKALLESVKLAIVAGTLQFHKAGVEPITKTELEALNQ